MQWSVAFNDVLSVTLMTGSDATYGLSLQLYPTAQCVKNKDVRDVFFCMMNTSQERTALCVFFLLALRSALLLEGISPLFFHSLLSSYLAPAIYAPSSVPDYPCHTVSRLHLHLYLSHRRRVLTRPSLQVLKRLYLCNTGKFLQEHQTTTKPSNL